MDPQISGEMMGKTLFEKVWDTHVVAQDEGAPAILYIDAHLIHEVTSPQAFTMLRERGLRRGQESGDGVQLTGCVGSAVLSLRNVRQRL
jgi:hypothetical protein